MKKRRMASIFKEPSKVSYELGKSLKKGSKVLIVDGFDGWHVFPFVRADHTVETYEPQSIFIDGGEIIEGNKSIIIHGLKKRINAYNVKKKVKYFNKNFYKQNDVNTYDFVHVYKSLHRKCHADMTVQYKIKKLQESVSDDGEIYIYYHLAVNDEDEYTYPKNQYLRTNEMISYFNLDEWDIIYYKERNKLRIDYGHVGHTNPHLHRIGYIHAKRKKHRNRNDKRNYKYHFHIKIGYTYI